MNTSGTARHLPLTTVPLAIWLFPKYSKIKIRAHLSLPFFFLLLAAIREMA